MSSWMVKVCKSLGFAVAMAAMTIAAFPAQAGDATDVKGVTDQEIPEPLFTEQAPVEKEVELEFSFDDKDTENEYEVGLGASWVFFDKLEIGTDIPIGIRDPDVGSTENNIGDVEFSAKYQFTEASRDGVNLALAGHVAAPTGDRDKEIGGTGEWQTFALASTSVPLGANLPRLGVHLQFGYQQEIRLSNEEKETAETLGVDQTKEKTLIWRLAFNTPLFDGRFVPTFEVLGQTIVDAVDSSEEGTIVELGGGFWWNPFPEGSNLEALAVGVAAKGPVTSREEANFSTLLSVKYEFE